MDTNDACSVARPSLPTTLLAILQMKLIKHCRQAAVLAVLGVGEKTRDLHTTISALRTSRILNVLFVGQLLFRTIQSQLSIQENDHKVP